MTGLSITALAIAVLYLALLGIKAQRAVAHLRTTLRTSGGTLGSVSIMQPIRSGDPDLKSTLEDTLLAHPEVELLWLVDEDDDCARTICAALAARHQHLHLRILTSPVCPQRINPKLFKLEAARANAQGQVLMVLDDDTRLPPLTLSALVAALDDSTLSTALPEYRNAGTFSSRLLATFVNDNAALSYLGLPSWMPAPTLNGMAWAIRADRLATLGGFAPSLGTLTDDLAIARQVLNAGGRIAQLPDPVHLTTTLPDFTAYIRQMHRWMLFALLLMKRQSWRNRMSIALLQGLPPILLWFQFVCAIVSPLNMLPLLTLAALFVGRTFVLRWVAHTAGRAPSAFLHSLLSELMQPLHLVHAACNRTVIWRERRYRVTADDCFEEVAK